MLFTLQTVPVAFNACSQLVEDSVLLLTEKLNIDIVTGEPEYQKGANGMVGGVFL